MKRLIAGFGVSALALLVACDRPAVQPASRPNVVLITLDTLRADHLPLYGYTGVKTPFLDRLGREGIVFEHAYSHAPLTLPSHTSILTGLYPPVHGVRNNGSFRAKPRLDLISEILKRHGYATAAFVSAFILDSRFGLDQGFDRYDDDLSGSKMPASKFEVHSRLGAVTVAHAIAWLRRAKQAGRRPFFMWMHLYDCHFPYAAPPPFNATANPYDGEIAYTDFQLGKLMSALDQLGELANSLIIVTADHGESLGDHGEATHALFVYEATQHIPLVIRLPGAKRAGTRVAALARHIDIVPTILDVVGLPKPADLQGRSLLRAARKPVVSYAEAYLPYDQYGWAPLFSVRQGRELYIEAPIPEYYRLDRDPDEQHNLYDRAPKRVAALKADLAALRATPGWHDYSPHHEMDAETRAQLEALGYVGRDPRDDESAHRGADPKQMIHISQAEQKAHQRMDAGDYKGALVQLRALLQQDPGNSDLVGDIAACLGELGQWKAAERAYRALIARYPNRAGGHVGLCKIYFKGTHDFAAAQKELDLANRLRPDDPGEHALQGDLFHAEGHFKKAAHAYELAIAAGNAAPSTYVGYASALTHLNRLKEARDAVEKAVRMDPKNAIAQYNHGVILDRLGLPAAAAGCLAEALRLDPSLKPATLALARIHAKRGLLNTAAIVLRAGAKLHPNDPDIRAALAKLSQVVAQQKAGRPPAKDVVP